MAQGCGSGSQGLQERAAGALWGLSVSEANSIAIGREGGVAPLITLAHSDFEVSFCEKIKVHGFTTCCLGFISSYLDDALCVIS